MIVMEDARRQPTCPYLVIEVLFYMGSDATSLCATGELRVALICSLQNQTGKPLFSFFSFPFCLSLPCVLLVAVAPYRVSLTQLTPDIYPF